MKEQTGRETLEDVLDAYVASNVGPNSPLDEWLRRYPDFEQEIIKFAASWSLMEGLPPAPDAEEVDEEALVLRGMSVVQNVLHGYSAESASESVASFESLIAEGEEIGFEPSRFAHAVGVGDSLLRKLDRRLIAFASIPQELIDRLAQVVQREATTVIAYLRQDPKLPGTTEYRSEQAPIIMDLEDFFDAVHADPTISREHAEHWFALERSMGQR